MKGATLSIAVLALILCSPAATAQDVKDSKEPAAKKSRGLAHFESTLLSGNQTKDSAYREIRAAKDPEGLARAKYEKAAAAKAKREARAKSD
jgi:hypothetical protein